jgi:prevent-host-death family protein
MAKAVPRNKSPYRVASANGTMQMAAGEFKAKCLALIDDVHQTGREILITKRGEPRAKLAPLRKAKKKPFFGRLVGIMKINGDPDDLVNPAFPLEDWDMLK